MPWTDISLQHHAEHVHQAYPSYRRSAAQAPPPVYSGSALGHPYQISPWPASIDPSLMTLPSARPQAPPPAFLPASIDQNFAVDARTSPSPVESHTGNQGPAAVQRLIWVTEDPFNSQKISYSRKKKKGWLTKTGRTGPDVDPVSPKSLEPLTSAEVPLEESQKSSR
jgi:hypothetical protein